MLEIVPGDPVNKYMKDPWVCVKKHICVFCTVGSGLQREGECLPGIRVGCQHQLCHTKFKADARKQTSSQPCELWVVRFIYLLLSNIFCGNQSPNDPFAFTSVNDIYLLKSRHIHTPVNFQDNCINKEIVSSNIEFSKIIFL